MAQANINYGAFPNDPSANTIRDAFAATQTNFNQLFAGAAANANVSQIIPGAGISVSPANGVGNVTVTNNFNSLRVKSNTLSVSSLGGSLDGNTVIIPNSSATLILEISSNTNSNSSLYNLSVSNTLAVTGSAISANTANITLGTGNIVLTSGSLNGNVQAKGSAGSVQYRGNGNITSGSSVFTYNDATNVLTVPQLTVTQISTGNITGSIAQFGQAQANSANTGNLVVTNNLSGNTANFTGNISAPGITGNVSGNLINANLANAIVFYQSNGVSSGSSNLRYQSGNVVLSNGNIVAPGFVGNLTGTASLATTVVGGIQSNISQLGNLSFLNVFGNAIVGSLSANANISASAGNIFNLTVANTLTVTNISGSRANILFDVVAAQVTANGNVISSNVITTTVQANQYVSTPLVRFQSQPVDPTNPNGGDVYYNGVTGKLRVYNAAATQWQDLN